MIKHIESWNFFPLPEKINHELFFMDILNVKLSVALFPRSLLFCFVHSQCPDFLLRMQWWKCHAFLFVAWGSNFTPHPSSPPPPPLLTCKISAVFTASAIYSTVYCIQTGVLYTFLLSANNYFANFSKQLISLTKHCWHWLIFSNIPIYHTPLHCVQYVYSRYRWIKNHV